ncbi:MAG: C_GCAxxG_C_C family protein [Lachnospiraceae bacterium]|nr:C_GCAxxG_C_C family protein [Lachnospiraceae bacterium]
MTTKEKALDYFSRNFHCSQAVLAAYADKCGLTEEQALRLGGCFGSGMRKGEVCGACTGALMVLGALYGQCDEADLESRGRSNKVNDEMMDGFAKKMGSCLCRDVLGCDVSTEEGVRHARENNLFKELCPKVVADAVDVLEEVIAANESR